MTRRNGDLMTAYLTAARGPVAEVMVPPFDTGYPPAIMFGSRFFLRMGGSTSGHYLETFCYVGALEVRRREVVETDHGA